MKKDRYVIGFVEDEKAVFGSDGYIRCLASVEETKKEITQRGFQSGRLVIYKLIPILIAKEIASSDQQKYTWRKP